MALCPFQPDLPYSMIAGISVLLTGGSFNTHPHITTLLQTFHTHTHPYGFHTKVIKQQNLFQETDWNTLTYFCYCHLCSASLGSKPRLSIILASLWLFGSSYLSPSQALTCCEVLPAEESSPMHTTHKVITLISPVYLQLI